MKTESELFQKIREKELSQINEFKLELANIIGETFSNWKKTEKGINQTTFAKIVGCSQSRVSNIINGNVSLFTVDRLLGLCTRIGCNPILKAKPTKLMTDDSKTMLKLIHENVA